MIELRISGPGKADDWRRAFGEGVRSPEPFVLRESQRHPPPRGPGSLIRPAPSPLPRVPEPPLRPRSVAVPMLGSDLGAVDRVAEIPILTGPDPSAAVGAVDLPGFDERLPASAPILLPSSVIGDSRLHRSRYSRIRGGVSLA